MIIQILHSLWEMIVTFFFGYGLFAFRDDMRIAIKNRRSKRRFKRELHEQLKTRHN